MQANLEKSIKRSGNNLHIKVADLLIEQGWEAQLSAYYLDDTTNKPREIDIIASKTLDLLTRSGVTEEMKVYLFIECKNFGEEIAFWMYKNAKNFMSLNAQSIPYQLLLSDGLLAKHHYLNQDTLGWLYDREKRDSAKDVVFDSITQPIKSLTFFRDKHPTQQALYYPVCVYEGIDGIYKIESREDIENLQTLIPAKSLTVGLNYSYKSSVNGHLQTGPFCIDFVHFDDIQNFLSLVMEESNGIKNILQFAKTKPKTQL